MTATEETKKQREAMSHLISMQEESGEGNVDSLIGHSIDRYEAEAKVIAVCEVFNASNSQRYRTKLVLLKNTHMCVFLFFLTM